MSSIKGMSRGGFEFDSCEVLEEFIGVEMQNRLDRAKETGREYISVDFDEVLSHDFDMAQEILDDPKDLPEFLDKLEVSDGVSVRFRNLPDPNHVDISNVRREHVGSMIQLKGVVASSTEPKLRMEIGCFKCRRCGELNFIDQGDRNRMREPTICQNPDCSKKGPFRLLERKSEYKNVQFIDLQEEISNMKENRNPRTLSVILEEDLVDKAFPGERVNVIGRLDTYQIRNGNTKTTNFGFEIKAQNIWTEERTFEQMNLSEEDKEEIENWKEKHGRPKNIIVRSIAPDVKGMSDIKLAAALQMVRTPKVVTSTDTERRSFLNILMVGDPGLAKSVVAKRVAKLTPKGKYTSGAKSTGPGLTATAERDERTGEWKIKAGALPQADSDVLAVDDFEQISEQVEGHLLESMEQGTVSVSKANLSRTLLARTSILACSNPRKGRFDRFEDYYSQIPLKSPLLSRFDLIFAVKDEPSKEKDEELAKFMFDVHQGSEDLDKDNLDDDFLRKIIAYSRTIEPDLPDELREEASEFYSKMREMTTNEGDGFVPITPRQFETILRLTKAHARLRLSDKVEKEDLEQAITLMKSSFESLGLELQSGGADVVMTGISPSQRDKIRELREIIDDLYHESGKQGVSLKMVFSEAEASGIGRDFVDEWIKKCLKKGDLIELEEDLVEPNW